MAEEKATLRIPAIHCDGCLRTIRASLGELPGVRVVSADERSKLVTLALAEPAALAAVRERLESIGFVPEE